MRIIWLCKNISDSRVLGVIDRLLLRRESVRQERSCAAASNSCSAIRARNVFWLFATGRASAYLGHFEWSSAGRCTTAFSIHFILNICRLPASLREA